MVLFSLFITSVLKGANNNRGSVMRSDVIEFGREVLDTSHNGNSVTIVCIDNWVINMEDGVVHKVSYNHE